MGLSWFKSESNNQQKMTRILYYYNIAMLAKIWYTITIHRKGEMIMKTKLITLILSALAAASLFALTACGNGNALTETANDVSSFNESSSVESEATSEIQNDAIAEEPIGSVEQPVEEPVDTTTNNTNAGSQTNQNNSTTYAPPSNGNVNTGGNNGGSTNTGTATKPQQQQPAAPAQTQPTIHQPIYKQQWVVDQAAWSEKVPVWGNKYIEVCNTCKADITVNPIQHLLNTEHSGYHTDVISVQTGTRTIHHEEQGHYENVLICGGCTGNH